MLAMFMHNATCIAVSKKKRKQRLYVNYIQNCFFYRVKSTHTRAHTHTTTVQIAFSCLRIF